MKTKSVSLFFLTLVWGCALAIGSSVQAQTSTSRITGTVFDQAGAVLPGATVTATHEGTGVKYTTTTTTAGTYALESLPVGVYRVTVEAPGFRTFTSTGNVLTVGAPLVVNATMEVGQATEVIEVVGTYERIETSHAMLSGVVTRRAIVELPLNGRNPLNLIVLEPGLVQRSTGAAGSGTHVFGSRDRAHNVTIDGIDANESSVPNPQSNIHRLNPDNVQEYRVVTHNATPEFGRNSGANVTIATRSGTNEFHGDVYYFHRNTALNANEFFNNASGLQRPILLMHQFGASGGGPIIKNKTFFFASWQGNRIMQTQPIAGIFGTPLVYTDMLKSGVFRYFVPDPANPLVIDGVTITRNSPRLVDPLTGALRPGVRMCATPTEVGCIRTYNIFASDPAGIGADPTIAALIRTFPSPNSFNVGDGLNTAGFAWNPPSRFVGPHYMVRVDHKFDENNTLFGRMLWSDYDTRDGDFLNARPAIFPGFDPLGEVTRSAQNLAISYRRVLSPTLVNEFTTGYSRFFFTFLLMEANTKSGRLQPPPYAQECFGTDSFSLIDTPFCNTPHTQRAVSTIQFVDNLSYVRGAHNIRTGFNIRLYRHNDQRGVPGGFNMSPTIIFSRTVRPPTSNTAPGVAAGFPVAPGINSTDNNNLLQAIVELVGIPARVQQVFIPTGDFSQYISDLFAAGTRAKQYNFYGQDEWKIRRNLTMTYGLRWEINRPPTDCCDRVFVPDRPVGGSQGPVTYVRADSWFRRDNWAAFAPRLAFAWDPTSGGKMVVRTGYGLAFDTISTFQVTSIAGKIPGSVLQCIVNIQSPPTPPCADIPNDLRLTQLLAMFNPFTLPPPTVSPTSQLSPAPQPLGVAPSVGAFDPNLKIPTVHEWNLTIQRELPWNFVGQVGYVGKRGTRLYRAYDLNQLRTDQPGFLQEFMAAFKNIAICKANPTACLNAQAAAGIAAGSRTVDNFANFGLPGQVDLPLLSRLLGATSLTSANYRGSFATDVLNFGLGDLAARIDQLAGTSWIVNRGFPANYFRPNPQFSEIFWFDSGGSSIYHGMIVQLQRRYEKGLTFGLSYTLSKSIDDMSVDPVAATSGGGLGNNSRTPTDVRNFRLDRALSDFDNRHVVVINGLYDLPFGRGQRWGSGWNKAVNALLGGWTLSGIYIYQSGEPFTLNSGVRTANATSAGKQTRAELRGPMPKARLQSVPGIQGPVVFNVGDRIVDPADPNYNCRQVLGTQSYFCIPAPGQFGMSRNAVPGPGYWNMDMGIIKRLDLTERVNLQFRTEFFNVFNHSNFNNPRNASVGSPTLTSSLFGQTCCITSSVPSSATIIATGEPNRVIQMALKLSF